MEEDLVVLLGGRVAEALMLDDISTGASNDLERATKLARAMVTKYGMSKALGPITYGRDESEPFLGRDMGHIRDYSDETAASIDAEIKNIMTTAYDRTETILRTHKDQLEAVAQYLFHHEKMDGAAFQDLMEGKRLEDGGGDSQKPLPESPAPVPQA